MTSIRRTFPRRFLGILVAIASMDSLVGCAAETRQAGPPPVVWELRDVANVAHHATEVVGAPTVDGAGARAAIRFDGKADGVFVPVNPIEG